MPKEKPLVVTEYADGSQSIEREYEGQFPSPDCHCHIAEPYGFVPEAGCEHHDTPHFLAFVAALESRARRLKP